jgi:hypothetical protein
MSNAVGFYWTLPVNWADFRDLDENVEVAAQRSKTIRYQMELVRRWAKANAYQLPYEIAYIDTRTDRATDGCKSALVRARQKCTDPKAALIYVNFEEANFWRKNPFIQVHARTLGFKPIGLPPDAMTIDDKLFDPIKHFKDWRNLDKTTKVDLRRAADEGLLEAYLRFDGGEGRYTLMAQWLNDHGIKTATGKAWSDENVRKAIRTKIGNCASETEQATTTLPGILD